MSEYNDTRLAAVLVGLRGALMLVGGIYALLFPVSALAVLVLLAGAFFLIDGVLGLWSTTFGGARTGNFWFDVVRNVLSIVLGVLIFLSPILSAIITVTFLIYLVAIQALIVGVMEIVVIVRERALYAKIWPVLLSGVVYVVFGVSLLIWPMLGASVMVMFGGALMIVFAIGLFGLAFRLFKGAATSQG